MRADSRQQHRNSTAYMVATTYSPPIPFLPATMRIASANGENVAVASTLWHTEPRSTYAQRRPVQGRNGNGDRPRRKKKWWNKVREEEKKLKRNIVQIEKKGIKLVCAEDRTVTQHTCKHKQSCTMYNVRFLYISILMYSPRPFEDGMILDGAHLNLRRFGFFLATRKRNIFVWSKRTKCDDRLSKFKAWRNGLAMEMEVKIWINSRNRRFIG